jgi:hypothetical protein
MSIVALIVGLLKLVNSLIDYAQKKQIVNEAQLTLINENLCVSFSLIAKSHVARKLAFDKFNATNSLPDESDPNLRD